MVIGSSDKTLKLKLAGPITSSQLPWSCSYEDDTNNEFDSGSRVVKKTTPGDVSGKTTGTDPVIVIKGVDNSTATNGLSRIVNEISCINKDTAPSTVVFYRDDGSNEIIVFQAVLMPGFQAFYSKHHGWKVLTETGAVPVVNYIITSTSDVEVDFVAAEDIAQYKLVTSQGVKADTADYNTRNKIIGFATTSVGNGFPGKALTLGKLQNVAWSWTPGDRIFASINGDVSNAAPSSTYVQMVGTAITTDTIDVLIQQSILL